MCAVAESVGAVVAEVGAVGPAVEVATAEASMLLSKVGVGLLAALVVLEVSPGFGEGEMFPPFGKSTSLAVSSLWSYILLWCYIFTGWLRYTLLRYNVPNTRAKLFFN